MRDGVRNRGRRFISRRAGSKSACGKEGEPIANAVIQVTDEKGKSFAEGQTEDDGQAAFPMPSGASFTVEIKTGNRTSDPIRLFKKETGIEPARVLLSYGLRPCCRFLSHGDKEAVVETANPQPAAAPATSLPSWGLPVALVTTLLIAAAIWFVWKR